MPLSQFSDRTRAWFEGAFEAPTPAQERAWPAIATGEHVLLSAPTGSGKTLAVFRWAMDRLATDPLGEGERRTRLVYVAPLKALSYDIERNLRAPLKGIGADISVAIRTGDTTQRERAAMRRHPPDVLITTPESLYLILTSQAREMLTGAEWAIVDEIHAVAQTKRGAHLALTLERLALRLNELAAAEEEGHDPQGPAAPPEIARAHHGSLAHEERLVVEEELKSGRLPCLVATSSLELGIDMGAVDLVLQVESPKSVSRGMQRIGRAGHNVGDVSKGRLFPKFRADLLEVALVARRMRVGELDEEMVYEARPGQTFLLGASSWRIEEIGRDRVVVTPAPGVPGAVPFWKGDGIGRPKELGEAIGAFSRWAVEQPAEVLERDFDLDELAARNLLAFLREQQAATRVVPSDRTIVIERFRDEIGDWRVCVLSPYGGRGDPPGGPGRPAPRPGGVRLGLDAARARRRHHRAPPRADQAPGP